MMQAPLEQPGGSFLANEAIAVYNTYINSFTNRDGGVNWLPVCADAHGFVVNRDLLKSMIFLCRLGLPSFISACGIKKAGIRGLRQTIVIMIIHVWKQRRDCLHQIFYDGRKWRTIYGNPGKYKRKAWTVQSGPEALNVWSDSPRCKLGRDDLDTRL